MPEYSVERVDAAKPFETGAGHKLVSYTVLLKGPEGTGEIAQRNMKPDSQAPKVGDVWDCILEPNGSFPKKVKMVPKASFGGGGSSRNNPEDMRQRAAQGALSNAVQWAAHRDTRTGSQAATPYQDVLKLADAFYTFIRAKAEDK